MKPHNTSIIVSKLVRSVAISIGVQEQHLVLNDLVARGRGMLAGAGICVDQKPEVWADPLVHKMTAPGIISQFHCKRDGASQTHSSSCVW